MSQLSINLPTLEGEIEADITNSVEISLSHDQKLPISVDVNNKPSPIAVVKQNALIWALDKYTDITAKHLFLNGISGLIDLGLLCVSNGFPDGDWFMSTATFQVTGAAIESIVKIVNEESMKKAINVAIATKADFWSTNHHIKRTQVMGYTKELLYDFYPNAVTNQVISAARSLGHYASTLYVLHLAGIKGILAAHPFVNNEGSSIILSNDSKFRFKSMPAGTHKLDIAYQAAKKLTRSTYADFCPNLTDFKLLFSIYDQVHNFSATYHISASYLTGKPRANYHDSDMDNYLGRLGTFITTLYKNSTLAKSPCMAPAIIESYNDYDVDFKTELTKVKIL